ncbi:MAG: hypothetical protein A2Y73_06780 [Chloroflexi bacterium RBG_13_56_8]|nr:MAG: hypothetical protein A2Y73_06780 [Chloroflexi bacterium RBG_13_56_8]
MAEIDARGLPCPQPVILTRNAMRENEEILVLVSGRDQVGNVQRLGERAGWQVTVGPRGDHYAVRMIKGEGVQEPELMSESLVCAPTGGAVVVVSSDHMGRGDEELGMVLVRAFFHALTEIDVLPSTLIFYNAGVKLAIEGSPVLEDLRAVEESGVEILVCGTCLGYYDVKEKIGVGVISNMYTIAETLLGAGSVVTL